jgi:ketosteroid isomerase-like protein
VVEDLPKRLIAFYEALGDERERALERLPELFTERVRFRDPFREIVGIASFRALFVAIFRRYPRVGFSGFRVDGAEPRFALTYDMHVQMVVGPEFVTPFATVCRTEDGKVSELSDYYDFATGLVSPFPRATALYRTVTRKLLL